MIFLHIKSFFYDYGGKMKKILLLTLLCILIPYILVIVFLKEDEIKFDYNESLIVRVKREKTGNIDYVYLEDYITGVLAGELPITFSDEAFKAQAVAARSYVLKKMEYNKRIELLRKDETHGT